MGTYPCIQNSICEYLDHV